MSQRGTIVYVHGASDRGPQVDDHVAQIERQILLAGMDFDVVPSRWGEAVGARLDRLEAALPAAAPPPAPAAERGDVFPSGAPLGELAKLARSAGPANSRGSSHGATWREADQLLAICRSEVGVGDDTLREACSRAAADVASSDEYRRARAPGVPEAVLIWAVGRAVAATVAGDSAVASASASANLFEDVQVRIAEAVLGIAAATLLAVYLGIDVGPDLKRWATDVLVPHRARITRDVALGPADAFLYQRNGERIRAFVAQSVADALRRESGPVVALGNSLGGIILVDTLSQPGAPRPRLLATVGSQAPLLATFGALDPLGLPGSRPPFQPWLNIFDRRDFLGFVAGPVWPGEVGIIDREVDMGLGFPDSHGLAYLRHADTYAAITEQLDSTSGGSSGGGAAVTVPRRFPFRLGARSWPILRLFGVRQGNAYVDLDGGLDAHFGRFRIKVPLSNVTSWRIEGPWRWWTAIGVRRSVRHGDVTFGGNHKGGVRLNFREPVKWGPFQVPALYVTVVDMEGLGAALAERGIQGGHALK